ncbi:MAG: DUF268 domain-containing protein [Saprospiraceae bacterium]|nr:DUF268 domain-containing protein [Saprospiraceae bacterium]
MKRIIRGIENFGISPVRIVKSVVTLPWFYRSKRDFIRKSTKNDFPFAQDYLCLNDRYDKSGTLSGQYFHMDLHVAQRIFLNQPIKHVDVGSNIQGFVAHVASYREIEIFDIRPNESNVKNISFRQADFSNPVSLPEGYTDSLSCLHAIEHFGLGRYGDSIDPDGHLKGLDNMYKLIKPGGKFYFATPIGPQRIEFNAHRVFSLKYLMNLFNGKYRIEQFSYVDDRGDLYTDLTITDAVINSNCNCRYGCGIFEMVKI